MIYCCFLGEENKHRWVHEDSVMKYKNKCLRCSRVCASNIIETEYNWEVVKAIEFLNEAGKGNSSPDC